MAARQKRLNATDRPYVCGGAPGLAAENAGVPLELSPKLIEIFEDGQQRYGPREWSSNIIRRLEDACGTQVLAPGFPAQMVDDEPEEPGYEVIPKR